MWSLLKTSVAGAVLLVGLAIAGCTQTPPGQQIAALGVTGFGLLFTPAFYTFVRSLGRETGNATVSSEYRGDELSRTRFTGS